MEEMKSSQDSATQALTLGKSESSNSINLFGFSEDEIAKEVSSDDLLSAIPTKIHLRRKDKENKEEDELALYPRLSRSFVKLLTYNIFLRGGGIGSIGSNIEYYIKK